MVRCADMEMIVREEEACIYSRSLETGSIACHAGPHEEILGWARRPKRGEENIELYWSFCRKKWVRQGK